MIRAENMDEEVVRVAQEALRRRSAAAPPATDTVQPNPPSDERT